MIEHKQVLKFIDEYRTNGFDHAIVFYKSPLGHFIDANERAAYIAGVEPSQLAGKKDAELRWSCHSAP